MVKCLGFVWTTISDDQKQMWLPIVGNNPPKSCSLCTANDTPRFLDYFGRFVQGFLCPSHHFESGNGNEGMSLMVQEHCLTKEDRFHSEMQQIKYCYTRVVGVKICLRHACLTNKIPLPGSFFENF